MILAILTFMIVILLGVLLHESESGRPYNWIRLLRSTIRVMIRLFTSIHKKRKWNNGICRKCNNRWFLDAYDEDRIWMERYKCGCGETLYSTDSMKELSDEEATAVRRENKLKDGLGI